MLLLTWGQLLVGHPHNHTMACHWLKIAMRRQRAWPRSDGPNAFVIFISVSPGWETDMCVSYNKQWHTGCRLTSGVGSVIFLWKCFQTFSVFFSHKNGTCWVVDMSYFLAAMYACVYLTVAFAICLRAAIYKSQSWWVPAFRQLLAASWCLTLQSHDCCAPE